MLPPAASTYPSGQFLARGRASDGAKSVCTGNWSAVIEGAAALVNQGFKKVEIESERS
jgi:hypothetical protein